MGELQPIIAPTELPIPLTTLVDRERELADLRTLVIDPTVHLVTLTGPGGVGKTRLALHLATDLQGKFDDGVVFVELAAITDITLLPSAIARAVGVRETPGKSVIEPLERFLQHRAMLLVLDNFERLLDAGTLLTRLLAASPRLKIVVTSRSVLLLTGEHIFEVAPLRLPGIGQSPPLPDLASIDAVALFIERARAVRSNFQLTEGNGSDVAEICRHLDGLPLAIELAAARCDHLSPAALLARLEQRLTVLTGGPRDQSPRLQAMRNAIDWSHELLSADEQALFRRLAVFAGGFDLAAAEAIMSSFDDQCIDVADAISSLLRQSLLRRADRTDEEGELRFAMYETIHEYASERLLASGEESAARAAHAAYFVSFAERAEPELLGPNQSAWIKRLEIEHDNLRAALAWSMDDRDADTALRLAPALWQFWIASGFIREGRSWLQRALDRADDSLSLRAKTLERAGALANLGGEQTESIAEFEEAIELRRALGDPIALGHALHDLGQTLHMQGEYDRAAELLQEAITLYANPDDPVMATFSVLAVSQLGCAVAELGERDRGLALCEEALNRQRTLGHPLGVAMALSYLGEVLRARGDLDSALNHFRKALALIMEIGSHGYYVLFIFRIMVIVLAEVEDATRAVLLAACHEAACETMGARTEPRLLSAYDEALSQSRLALGDEAFADAWEAGLALTFEDAIAEALDEDPHAAQPALICPKTPATSPLTPRELDVLRLIAEGFPDKQIAAELLISHRTVTSHVTSMLTKLGAQSRSAAVALAVRSEWL